MFVKFCGMTRECDVEAAIECGADAIGFVFYKKSTRYVSPEKARRLMAYMRGTNTKAAGVFVDEDAARIVDIAQDIGLAYVQLYSQQAVQFVQQYVPVIMAYRVGSADDLAGVMAPPNGFILLDSFSKNAFGGTGMMFDWNLLCNFRFLGRTIVSGGLRPDNVAGLIHRIRPFGVDVSSGIEESPGTKSAEKMRAFMNSIQEALDCEKIAR